MEQGESAAPGAASAARAGVRISFAGRSGPAVQAVRTPQRIAAWPLDEYSPAVACGGRGVSRRHLSRQPFGAQATVRCPASGHDVGSLLRHARDLAPRPVALCTPDRSSGPRVLPRAAAQWPSRIRPHFARDRDVALGALAVASTALPRDLRRGTSGTFRCRHRRRTPVQRRPRGASDCGGLYHAVITAASTACLAEPCRHWPERRFSTPSLPDSRALPPTPNRWCYVVRRPAGSDGAAGIPPAIVTGRESQFPC